MADTPSLEELHKNVHDTHQAVIDAQQAHAEADAAHKAARTATFDPELVQTARDYGINPDNFESPELLQQAVDNFPEDEKPKAPAPAPSLDPELVANAERLGLNPADYIDNDHIKNAIFKAETKTEENPDVAPAE